MKRLALFLLGLLPLLVSANRPNVIYILADDLGYGDLSSYGQTKFQTPHIDSLVRTGMKFTQHYSGAPVCAPSRAALMTGQHTGHTAIRGNGAVPPEGQKPMPADTFTLAHLFQQAGYTTGVFGKWGLGAPDTVSEPRRMGFDRFYGYNCQRQAHFYYPYFLWDDNQRVMLWNNFGNERGDYAPDLIQKEALAFIAANREQPFFLYYAMVQPHAEMVAPEPYMEKFRGQFDPEKPFEGTDTGPDFRKHGYGSQAEPHAAFAAMVATMDDAVGELLAKLKELGLSENTLVIFTSDNGPHKEGGHNPAYFNSSGGLRGVKRDLYEGGIRVPMVASWPGMIPAGAVTDHVSAFWDVLPTVADLLDASALAAVDGLSFLPTLLGTGTQAKHDHLYWEFHEQGGKVALRQGDWKAVRTDVAIDPHSPLELYNLATDSAESVNVAAVHPALVAALDALIKNSRTVSPNPDFNFPGRGGPNTRPGAHEAN